MGADPHILFLYGNDEYAIAQRLREFASVFTDASEAEMNTSRLDARTMTQDEWVNAVNVLPFLAKQRLVLLANPSARFVQRRSKLEEEEVPDESSDSPPLSKQPATEPVAEARRRFLDSLEHIPPTTQLVMWEFIELKFAWDKEKQDQQDSRHWLIKWIKKQGMALERFALPAGRDMPGWIARYARTQGGEIVGSAAMRLANMVGTDTRQAAQEVTKLLTYVNWSRPVTPEDVETLSPLTAAPDVFAMVDALSRGHGKDAQRLLHRLLDLGDPFGIWGMIVRQFRHLIIAREVLDSRGGEVQAIRALSEVEGRDVQPFVARKALDQARGFTMPRLELIYHQLLEIDEAAKTGRMPLEVALDVLVAELTT